MREIIWGGVAKVFRFLLSFFSYTSGFFVWLFLYLPFGITVRVAKWNEGVNEKSLMSFIGFIKFYRSVFYGVLFPKTQFFMRLGYVFVLPFLKGGLVRENGSNENGATSMYVKYFEALKDGRKVNLAPEYLDTIHSKYTLFLTITAVISVAIYLCLMIVFFYLCGGYIAMSLLQIITSLGSMFFGASKVAMSMGIGSLFNLAMAITMIYVAFHLIVVSLVLAYQFFKEIRTMQNLSNFAKESAKMVYYSLKEVNKDNAEMLEKVETAMVYLVESCKVDSKLNDEFFTIDEKYLLTHQEVKKIENHQNIEN